MICKNGLTCKYRGTCRFIHLDTKPPAPVIIQPSPPPVVPPQPVPQPVAQVPPVQPSFTQSIFSMFGFKKRRSSMF